MPRCGPSRPGHRSVGRSGIVVDLPGVFIVAMTATRGPDRILGLVFESKDARMTVGEVNAVAHPVLAAGQIHQATALFFVHQEEGVINAVGILIQEEKRLRGFFDLIQFFFFRVTETTGRYGCSQGKSPSAVRLSISSSGDA